MVDMLTILVDNGQHVNLKMLTDQLKKEVGMLTCMLLTHSALCQQKIEANVMVGMHAGLTISIFCQGWDKTKWGGLNVDEWLLFLHLWMGVGVEFECSLSPSC